MVLFFPEDFAPLFGFMLLYSLAHYFNLAVLPGGGNDDGHDNHTLEWKKWGVVELNRLYDECAIVRSTIDVVFTLKNSDRDSNLGIKLV